MIGLSHRDNHPIFHHIELLHFEALQTDMTDEIERLVSDKLHAIAPRGAQTKLPSSNSAYSHPLATLIEPYVIAILHEKAPLIIADCLSKQRRCEKTKP